MSWIQNGQHEFWLFMKYFGFWAIGLIACLFVALFVFVLVGRQRHPDDFETWSAEAMNKFFASVFDPIFHVIGMVLKGFLIVVVGLNVICLAVLALLTLVYAYHQHSPLQVVLVIGVSLWVGKMIWEIISDWWSWS